MKIAAAFLKLLLFLVILEISGRTYHCIKYKDPTVYLYGRNYFKSLIRDMRAARILPDSSPQVLALLPDEIFESRKARNVPIITKEPENLHSFGQSMHFNKFGMRNTEIELEKAVGTTRIMAFGESFVMCPGVDDQSTWEYLLSEKMKKLPGKYEVINAGAGGHTINHNVVNLIDILIKFSPDYIIFFSAHNNHGLLDYKKERSVAWQISNFFYNISQLYAMIRERSALKTFKDNNYYLYNYDVKITKVQVDSLLAMYRKRLGQIYTVCRENNIELIFGLQPEFIPSGLRELQDLLDAKQVALIEKKLVKKGYLAYYEFEYYLQGRFNLEMKDFAEQNGSLLFDGISIFPRDKYPYFIDQIHLNGKGTALFAGALYDYLVRNNIAKDI